MEIEIIDFQKHGDDRGGLVSLELNNNIPFDIKRVYYIFDTLSDVTRGRHAHKRLRQLTVAVKGSCRFLLDDGNNKLEIVLNCASQGLYIGPGVWREMSDFSDDCVLLVLADDIYDEADYIRDYQQFLDAVNDQQLDG
jgi:dTDP-4-dehydrorhamnose 3,5-epimerase-like enzyme